MIARLARQNLDLTRRLAESEATLFALLSGQIDAVVDPASKTPVLLSKAQDALRASEERYRRIVETANEGIWAIDEMSVTTYVNARMARMLGYTVEEMRGMPVGSLVAESARDDAALAIERVRQGTPQGIDALLLRKDGALLSVWISSAAISNSEGGYSGALAMVTDRTQARAAEEALQRSEAQYRQIVETTTDGIMTVDPDGTILFVNRRFTEMLGYAATDMVGRSSFAFMTPAGQTAARGAFKRREAGITDSRDSAFLHRAGTEIEVNIAGSPIQDTSGKYVGSLVVVRDVTEQRRLQAQLMVSDRMASVGTLAAGVAHEINNPLAAVMANLDYIAERVERLTAPGVGRGAAGQQTRDAWFREDVSSPLTDARDGAERMRLIVRDLKMFSRAPTEERAGAVDVEAIMESTLRMAWNEIRHRARLVKNYGPVPPVQANEARLGQVFLNLIVNAAQAIQEGGAESNEIRVSTGVANGRVVIEVTDTGPGIAPEVIARVFDAFFTTKAVGSGTGLGLAICQRIVTDMNGEITVESALGSGTTFRVSLPIALTDEPSAPVTAAPAARGRRGRILVVDDEELILSAVKRILSREHDVTLTTSARDALELCRGGDSFDLILCDLMMPDMTGMELHAELSRIASAHAGRIIFVTGGAFTEKAKRFLSEPPKEHIEKPFDVGNLRAIVQRYLR